MDIEKLVMEIYGRVSVLEEENKNLTSRIKKLEKNTKGYDLASEETAKITRSVAREYIMAKLQEENPVFDVLKGRRKDGADLVFNLSQNEDEDSANFSLTTKKITYPLKANFYHSKNYESDYVRGWHTVKKDDLDNENIHFYIFIVEDKGSFYSWVFSRVDLILFCRNNNKSENQNTYHFYFTKKDNEMYEERDGKIDVTPYYEKWDIPSKKMRV